MMPFYIYFQLDAIDIESELDTLGKAVIHLSPLSYR